MPWPLSEATPALFFAAAGTWSRVVAPNLQLLTFSPQPLVLPSLPLYFVTSLLPVCRKTPPPLIPATVPRATGPFPGCGLFSCPFFNFYFLFSSFNFRLGSRGKSFPAASFASARSRPLSSPALKRPSRQSQRRKSSARRSPFCELHSEHADTRLR